MPDNARAAAADLQTPLVELEDIVKVFPGVRANDGVTFTIRAGEIHGLLGENGAGKSTLMSILYGLYQPDGGQIKLDGSPVKIATPKKALELGIAIVQQHFALVPTLTVAQNVVLGQEPGWLVNNRTITKRVGELCERYRLELDPSAKVGDLSIGQQQRVEILKCLYREPKVVIFDEPTTVLIPQEIRDLFSTIRSLAAEGKGIVLITHKLDELLDITDRVTVLRAGKSSGTVVTSDVDGPTLAKLMVGRDVRLRSAAAAVAIGGEVEAEDRAIDRSGVPVMDLRNISVTDSGVDRLAGVSLQVAPGEILGVAGVEGNGQRELVELLCGTRFATSGSVTVAGADMTSAGAVKLGAAGVRVVTEDRHSTGCVLDMSVGENLLCDRLDQPPYSRGGVIQQKATDEGARQLIADYRVKTPGPHTPMRSLSGGNQQRAILARELSRPVTLLVAAQPTRGLDVGAIEEVTERVLAARDGGAGVLLISSDLSEILALSDRIAVMYRGTIVGVLDRSKADHDQLGLLMAGIVTTGAEA